MDCADRPTDFGAVHAAETAHHRSDSAAGYLARIARAAHENSEIDAASFERPSLLRAALAPLAALIVLLVLLWPHMGEIADATGLVSTRAIVAIALLHLVALFFRAEAWGRCVQAACAPVERSLLHSSSALRFLADTVVPTYVGAWVRVWLIRRFDRERAAEPGATPTPTIGQMVTADALMLLVEAVITIGLIAIAVVTSSLEWWWVAVLSAVVLLLLLVVRWLFDRYRDRKFARTARVLTDSQHRTVLTLMLVVVLTIQPIRFYITFRALGLDPSVSDALLAFLLTTVFNALPIGPGPSSIAAATTLFAGSGIDKTASAGLVLLATAIMAAMIYSLWCLVDLPRRLGERGGDDAGSVAAEEP